MATRASISVDSESDQFRCTFIILDGSGMDSPGASGMKSSELSGAQSKAEDGV